MTSKMGAFENMEFKSKVNIWLVLHLHHQMEQLRICSACACFYVRKCVCVRYVSICMEINIVLHIQFLNFWFGFDNFSFRIFQLNAKPHTHSCNSSKEFRYLWNFMQFHELFWSIFVVKRIFPENSVCCAHEKEERNRW